MITQDQTTDTIPTDTEEKWIIKFGDVYVSGGTDRFDGKREDHSENIQEALVFSSKTLAEDVVTHLVAKNSLTFAAFDVMTISDCEEIKEENKTARHNSRDLWLSTPIMDLKDCVSIEVYPCKLIDEKTVERFVPELSKPNEQPSFWSVALKDKNGLAETIADFPNQLLAVMYSKIIHELVYLAKYPIGLDPNVEIDIHKSESNSLPVTDTRWGKFGAGHFTGDLPKRFVHDNQPLQFDDYPQRTYTGNLTMNPGETAFRMGAPYAGTVISSFDFKLDLLLKIKPLSLDEQRAGHVLDIVFWALDRVAPGKINRRL